MKMVRHRCTGRCHLSAHLEGVCLLLRRGANVQASDLLENTPLHSAAASSSLPALVSLLVETGADLTAINKYGDTPLHTAAGFGNSSTSLLASLVIGKAGSAAIPSCRNRAGHTPLQLAVVVGWSLTAVSFLLTYEEPQQASNSTQLLELLVSRGWRHEIAEYLLRHSSAGKVSLGDLWQSLQLLSQQWSPSSKSFLPRLQIRFWDTVSQPNRSLRQQLTLLFCQLAKQSGAHL